MAGTRNLIASFARAGNDYREIKATFVIAFGDKTLQKVAIYAIINKVKTGKLTADMHRINSKKTFVLHALIASVITAIEEDLHLSLKMLAAPHGVSEK
jgi:hypothetical protein